MSEQNMVNAGNSLQISTQALAKIARCAALEIDGVADVSCGGQRKVRDLLERISIQQPVVVDIREGTAEITLHVMVAFGTKVPAMAEKLQKNVKSAIQNMTGVTVSQVNVVLAGIADPALAPAEQAEPAEE